MNLLRKNSRLVRLAVATVFVVIALIAGNGILAWLIGAYALFAELAFVMMKADRSQ